MAIIAVAVEVAGIRLGGSLPVNLVVAEDQVHAAVGSQRESVALAACPAAVS